VHIDVEVVPMSRSGDRGWQLRYMLRGPIALLAIPETASSGPADGLWRHTCFEAFVGTAQGSAYREFNFSPSGQWAAYSFSAERLRNEKEDANDLQMAPLLNVPPSGDRALVLEAWLPARALPAEVRGGNLTIGLSAVIETRDGHLSYWAITHPRDQPDFHHAEGRQEQLPHPSPT
jgi:hypothetical protein